MIKLRSKLTKLTFKESKAHCRKKKKKKPNHKDICYPAYLHSPSTNALNLKILYTTVLDMQPVTVPVTVLVYDFFLILRKPSAILLFGCFSLVSQWLGYLQNHLFTYFFWGYATCAPYFRPDDIYCLFNTGGGKRNRPTRLV